MPVLRKRVYLPHQDRIGQNGLYIHSNPPRGTLFNMSFKHANCFTINEFSTKVLVLIRCFIF